jgi:hypothetical protein
MIRLRAGVGPAAADAETLSLRCNDPGKGDKDSLPEYFVVDLARNAVTYNRSDGQSYTQISPAIDFDKGNGERVHIDRGTGVLTTSSPGNSYSLACHKVEGF